MDAYNKFIYAPERIFESFVSYSSLKWLIDLIVWKGLICEFNSVISPQLLVIHEKSSGLSLLFKKKKKKKKK
jgi:hypothetical protein